MVNNDHFYDYIKRRSSGFVTIPSLRRELSPTIDQGATVGRVTWNASGAYLVQLCGVSRGTKGQLS